MSQSLNYVSELRWGDVSRRSLLPQNSSLWSGTQKDWKLIVEVESVLPSNKPGCTECSWRIIFLTIYWPPCDSWTRTFFMRNHPYNLALTTHHHIHTCPITCDMWLSHPQHSRDSLGYWILIIFLCCPTVWESGQENSGLQTGITYA